MVGFGGVDEERGGAGGGERGGDLATDMAGLAEAGDDQPAFGREDGFGGGGEWRAEVGLQRGGERGDATGLGIERPQ